MIDFLITTRNHIVLYEGLKLKPYVCPSGKLTIGFGRNLDSKGISITEANIMLDSDIKECLEDIQYLIFGGFWLRFPDKIKVVMLDMRYNLGYSGFRNFKKMIQAAKRYDWKTVRSEMMNSNWYDQVGQRSIRLIDIVDEVIDENIHTGARK